MRRQIDTEKAKRAEAVAEREHATAELARMAAELEAMKKALEEARLAAGKPGLTVTPSAMEEVQCPICFSAMVDPTTLVCGHSSCLGCMHTALAAMEHRCPVCRANQPRNATIWVQNIHKKCGLEHASGTRACTFFDVRAVATPRPESDLSTPNRPAERPALASPGATQSQHCPA